MDSYGSNILDEHLALFHGGPYQAITGHPIADTLKLKSGHEVGSGPARSLPQNGVTPRPTGTSHAIFS